MKSLNLLSLTKAQLASRFASFFQIFSPLICVSIASFFCLVAHVVSVSAKKQMRWVSAFRVVALVKNVHILWDRTKVKHPRDAASGLFFSHSSKSKHSVPFGLCTKPFPTVVCFFNFGPKSISKRRCHNRMGLLQSPHFMQGVQ